MKRQCAWCGKDLGNAVPLESNEITHTICSQCNMEMTTLADPTGNAHEGQDAVAAVRDEKCLSDENSPLLKTQRAVQPDRRACPRLRELLPVLVLDSAEALGHPYRGWIVDHSPKGICLYYYGCSASKGDLLLVYPASAGADSPWVEVQVRNQRPKRSRVELGCEITGAAGATCFWSAVSRSTQMI